MKALLFPLLLLFIVISPSLTAPPSLPAHSTQNNVYRTNQRIIYTIFTEAGVFNIELLYSPRRTSLHQGNFKNIEFRPGVGYTEVEISQRRLDRWDLDANPPRAAVVFIAATIIFTPPPDVPIALGHAFGVLPPGVSIVPSNTVLLSQMTRQDGPRNMPRVSPHQSIPQTSDLVLMTILAPGAFYLDPQTVHAIQLGGIRGMIETFFQPAPGSLLSKALQLPMGLNPGIWLHLLSNTMSEYDPNAIPGALPLDGQPRRRPRTRARRHPDEGCSGSTSRQRDKDDQDDPEAEREGKRQCHAFDLNEIPVDQGKGKGKAVDQGKGKGKAVDQGDRQVPVGRSRSGLAKLWGSAISSLREFWADLTAPRTPAQRHNDDVMDGLTRGRFIFYGQSLH
jgi:hypothetical protein